MTDQQNDNSFYRQNTKVSNYQHFLMTNKEMSRFSKSTAISDKNSIKISDNQTMTNGMTLKLSSTGSNSSIYTIFSIWNTMVGSSLVALPWAFANSGIILGILISLTICLISLYTTYLYIILAGKELDFSMVVYRYFGNFGWFTTVFFLNFLMISVIIIYYEMMSQSLFPILAAIIEWVFETKINLKTDFTLDEFSLTYTCIGLTFILYPIINKKDMTIFIRVSSIGIICVILVLTFIFSYGFYSLTNTKFRISNEKNDFDSDERNISLFRSSFNSLAGMMTLGFYLHSLALPITKENIHPENTNRDISLGYLMVFLSMCLVGALGYVGFSGSSFHKDILETQNALYMFNSTHPIAFAIKIFCFFQTFTVFPMLF